MIMVSAIRQLKIYISANLNFSLESLDFFDRYTVDR